MEFFLDLIGMGKFKKQNLPHPTMKEFFCFDQRGQNIDDMDTMDGMDNMDGHGRGMLAGDGMAEN